MGCTCDTEFGWQYGKEYISCFLCKAKFNTKIIYKCTSCNQINKRLRIGRDNKGSGCEHCKARGSIESITTIVSLDVNMD